MASNECICKSLQNQIDKLDSNPIRKAICSQCNAELPAVKEILPFFQEMPKQNKDIFYCGCRGWD